MLHRIRLEMQEVGSIVKMKGGELRPTNATSEGKLGSCTKTSELAKRYSWKDCIANFSGKRLMYLSSSVKVVMNFGHKRQGMVRDDERRTILADNPESRRFLGATAIWRQRSRKNYCADSDGPRALFF